VDVDLAKYCVVLTLRDQKLWNNFARLASMVKVGPLVVTQNRPTVRVDSQRHGILGYQS
jgi:hypothetical protein